MVEMVPPFNRDEGIYITVANKDTRHRFLSRTKMVFDSTGLSDEERVNFVRPKNIRCKKTRKKTTQKIETLKYKVLFDHIFYDRNYSKVYKFRRYTIRKVRT